MFQTTSASGLNILTSAKTMLFLLSRKKKSVYHLKGF